MRRTRGASGPRLVLSSRVYLPAFSIVAVAVVLIAIGWASRWGGASFASSMTGLRVVVVGPITLVIIGVFLVVERMRPAQRRPLFARGYRQDLLYTILNATLVVPLVTALGLSFAVAARRSIPWIVVPRFGLVPRWVVIGMILVAMDGCNWLADLANHRVRGALALPRAASLAGGHERAHGLPHTSPRSCFLPTGPDPGDRAACQWCGTDDPPGRLRRNLGLRALEHQLRIRAVGTDIHQPELSPDPPQTRRPRRTSTSASRSTIWDQLSHRAIFPTPETIRIDTGFAGRR